MKPVNVKSNTYTDFNKEINSNPKSKIGDIVRISTYKNIFAEAYIPNWSEKVFVIKEVKNTVLWTYVINNLNGEEFFVTLYGIKLQKVKNKKEFKIEQLIKRKGDKLYVKWKGYNNSFNS